MGCGSSQSTSAVAPEQTTGPESNGTAKPAYRMFKTDPKHIHTFNLNANNITARAEAFEVPLDNPEGSIIKKHPPKRLLDRLAVETPTSTPTTIENLEKKLANAEIRRNKVVNVISGSSMFIKYDFWAVFTGTCRTDKRG